MIVFILVCQAQARASCEMLGDVWIASVGLPVDALG
jgi:hypothetical protein